MLVGNVPKHCQVARITVQALPSIHFHCTENNDSLLFFQSSRFQRTVVWTVFLQGSSGLESFVFQFATQKFIV